ncbi:FtsX-like permease family protein [Streptomyces sp. WI04-05B]|uniref:FtsX-like permease family protein n=1 Tax=Streptomyces TaxID=1883 RepID=UPI0029A294E1|nr:MULTISPECIES: FtsX-like permease family protein [unclassified Streptomyces]MDX2548073.1 ABC transporter permease [Streptomyces sp. WI04-05B]MDX2583047.1 ABC transporter permease [Streptomyces sp. WI04-05A]
MSSPVPQLTWFLARRSGRRGLHSQLLAAGAAAVGALILLVLTAAYFGSGTRAHDTAWRTPAPDRHGTAVQTLGTTYLGDRPVTVVSLAQLPGRKATPAPPGLTEFPKPGQVYVSPALADLLNRTPPKQLADRFPRVSSYGTIGDAGLAAPQELVAVVGKAASDPTVSSAAEPLGMFAQFGGLTARSVISGFDGTDVSVFASADKPAVSVGVAIVAVPVVVLAAAAGRLGAARREQRLAALRLAGATPRQILAMTGLESAVVGAAGALTGALAYCLLLPALAEIPFGIGSWYTGQLWVGLPWLLAVTVFVAALIAVSAMMTLRQVAVSPLGVAQQANPRRTRLIRLVVFAATLLYIYVTASSGGAGPREQLAMLLMFYGAFWLLGPWVVDRLGRITAHFARRPATLLAARRLSDDPRGSWRTVSGLVLAGFVAGFFTVGNVGIDDYRFPSQVAVPTTSTAIARTAAVEARSLLDAAGVKATVTTSKGDEDLLGSSTGVLVHVSGGTEQLDTAVTALSNLVPGQLPYTQNYANAENDAFTGRLGELGTAALAVSFLVATASAGLTAAANVLDRRRVYALLRLAGTPLKLLDRARFRETVLPLVVLAGGTTAAGIYAAFQVNKMFDSTISTSGAVTLAVCTTVGALAMFAAIGASRPLLRAVTENAAQAAD